jgi:platelet-activating factor acetylhydrolase
MPLRGKQLDIRLREVYETYHGFKRLISGETVDGLGIVGDHKPDVARSWLESLRGRVQVDEQVVGMGHSFGGATMVSRYMIDGRQR